MLIDPYGRIINYLRVSVTDRCNLRCVYCMPITGMKWLPRDEILSYEEIYETIRLAASLGITRIRVTGGEPLVRERLDELIKMLSSIKELEDLAITTNAVLLAPQAQRLKSAGLKRINISLDTLKPDRFKKIARFGTASAVERGIEAALTADLDPVKINMVVMRGVNDDEVVDLARLTIDRPLHVRFIELMPIGEYFTPEKIIPSAEILAQLNELAPLKRIEGIAGCGPAKMWKWDHAQGSIGIIGAVTQMFCTGCNRMRLTATGRLRPCLDDEQSADLKSALRPRVNRKMLEQLIRHTVSVKPEEHKMVEREEGARFCMASIGG